MRDRLVKIMLSVLILATLPTACVGPDRAPTPPAAGSQADLAGSEWMLNSLRGRDLVEGSHITLVFSDGQAGGFAGCNGYGLAYEATGDGALTTLETEITLQACTEPEGIMEQEATYVAALGNAAAYRVQGERLELADGAGDTVLVFTRQAGSVGEPRELVGSHWQLVSLDGGGPLEGSAITLVFHGEDRVYGQAGCRGYVASYEASSDGIRFPFFAMLTPGQPDCLEDEALQRQEEGYTEALGWAHGYRLGEGQLQISTERGEKLVFEPLPREAASSLEHRPWTLSAIVGERPVEGMAAPVPAVTEVLAGARITASFEEGMVGGSAGCNTYSARYAIEGPSIAIEAPAATEMACDDPAGVMEQEQHYLDALAQATRYHVHGSLLLLDTGDGRTLVAVRE